MTLHSELLLKEFEVAHQPLDLNDFVLQSLQHGLVVFDLPRLVRFCVRRFLVLDLEHVVVLCQLGDEFVHLELVGGECLTCLHSIGELLLIGHVQPRVLRLELRALFYQLVHLLLVAVILHSVLSVFILDLLKFQFQLLHLLLGLKKLLLERVLTKLRVDLHRRHILLNLLDRCSHHLEFLRNHSLIELTGCLSLNPSDLIVDQACQSLLRLLEQLHSCLTAFVIIFGRFSVIFILLLEFFDMFVLSFY